MSKIMALDIETTNFSHEIGGWGNTQLFDTSVVATWDGAEAHVFTKAFTHHSNLDTDGAHIHYLTTCHSA